ncbi:ABC transporter ATP-binding protein [Desulfosporosinus meridiei]|uniref:ABC-type dipeptide/oligopeptide/nickel transport system, ATPase component n=1 Tax=Desulfosporosinus meridiei (strain ATCC BAA-275 / DSM 13257 / KCTC 12902 / NCIMB 13706 / S10) TaxID=768704 RepID=J7ILY0_DESMD|nr:ATP-binding cassette domain-containing protein [Desulfosporosinus meridiei]AFQ42590.1 ABC-type dipeptide/oligopeptide/nickel transport system, ATPase component [Desulfosporosinus meridiei DSM 13257]
MQLEAKNIGFRYRKKPWLFRNFNLTLNSGEILGLKGQSGCGKTTLARVLAGYEKALEGSIELGGAPLPKGRYSGVQLVFQHPEKSVNPRWHMRDILQEGWRPDEEVLARFGIQPEWLSRWPNELSGGELQRFCVVRALSPETKFLIADEMTAMLDAITQAQIWQVMLALAKERNLGILVVSHEAELVNRVCDRVIELDSVHFERNSSVS